jgi:hypothetical protein
MTKLGPEFIGKLPPGRPEDVSRALDEYQRAYETGIA